jgi:hypothetical protein
MVFLTQHKSSARNNEKQLIGTMTTFSILSQSVGFSNFNLFSFIYMSLAVFL